MHRSTLPWLALLVGLLPILGCASIIKGGDQKILFQSDPSAAKVSVYDEDNRLVAGGTTPITLPLDKGASYFQAAKYRVVFEAPGRAPKEIWLTGSLEGGWYLAGNFLVGGLIGWLIVDPLTGAMWRLKPSTVTASLDAPLSSGEGGLRIALADEVPDELLARASPLPPLR